MVKNAKIWIILGAVVLVAAIAIVLVIVFTQPKKTESYRTIQIYDSEGSVTVDRENVGNLRAYANMRLQSGDVLTVGTDSHAYLKLDSDKYILAEEETVIEIIAEGTPEASRTTINLVQGAIVNRIDTVLNENSSYEVNASNSTMAIRGTLVRVSLKAKVEAPAQKEVSVSVFEGAVETGIKDASGNTTAGTARTVNAGGQVKMVVQGDSGTVAEETKLELRDMPPEVLSFLDKSAEEYSEKYDFDREELQDLINEKKENRRTFKVTLVVDDTVFAVYQVQEGDKPVRPSIQPTESGHWEDAIDLPVKEDITIRWVEDLPGGAG